MPITSIRITSYNVCYTKLLRIVGWVATHDQPALVNDTLSDPRHLREVAVETSFDARSILCVPLKVEGEVIGVVEVLNKTAGQQFSYNFV